MRPVIPHDIDPACRSLFRALNALPGIETTACCCGHGREPYRFWFYIHDTKSLGALALSRCLSGRYYNYAHGELRDDPQWRVYMGDTEAELCFVLEGKAMETDSLVHRPAESFARNLREHYKEDFATMTLARRRGVR